MPTKSKKYEKSLWANAVNLSGVWFKRPRKVYFNELLKMYFDKTGDFEIAGPGFRIKDNFISFASESKEEVATWTKGCRAAMTLLHYWVEYGSMRRPDTNIKWSIDKV